MVFSREKLLNKALAMKIRHAKSLAKSGDIEFKKQHNDEVKDAENNNYTKMVARITKEHKDNIARVMQYREKHWK
jgi:hypothetical protein